MNRIFKLLLAILLFAGTGVYAQCPQNIGFEDGSFTNWEAYVGEVFPGGDKGKGWVVLNSSAPTADRHRIMRATQDGLDEYGKFPTVSPNGSKYSVKLGNSTGGHQAERLSYTFVVPQLPQYSLILNYAMVLQNPDHNEDEQPRFTVNVYNVTDGVDVECPAFDFIARNSDKGLKISDVVVAGTRPVAVYYKDWTATTIELSAYVGKKIRLDFTTNDCTFNAHFGYAYFDINENCQAAITGNVICANQDKITLQGPKGFSDYAWYNANDLSTLVGNKQSLPLIPAPPIGTKYVLKVTATPGLACAGEFSTVIERIGEPYVFNLPAVSYFCPGTTYNLTAPSVTAGSSTGLTFEYYTDDVTQAYLRDPESISEPGVYYIRGTNLGGCTDVRRIELKYYDAVATVVTNPAPVKYPTPVDLSSTYQKDVGYSYSFFKDAAATKTVDDYQHVNTGGRYYIKVISNNGCQKILPVDVTVLPPPPFTISGPTVFTPNNDGINDKFIVTREGFVDLGTLSIYSRTGQFIFKTSQQNLMWDGNFNGKPMPAGTYYWVFEGIDQYYHKTFKRTGYVSIIK